MPKAKTPLDKLIALDLKDWSVTFWIINRRMAKKEASYDAVRVDIDKKLERRLRGYLAGQLQGNTYKELPYAFTNVDTEDVILTLEESDCDFPKVRDSIAKGFDNPRVKEYDELLHAWAYVVHFALGRKTLYACRKITTATDPKRVQSRSVLFFENHRLIDIDDKDVFLLDPTFDFFVTDGTVFIAHKRGFESAMNFREGMKAYGDELLAEFDTRKLLSDTKPLRDHVGNNFHYLRKLAAIKRAGYYKQPTYMTRLIQVNEELKWGLTVENGQIVVEVEKIDLILTLLNNDRLRSPINEELFDSGAKRPVEVPV
jgi:hypothetical protein